MKSCPLCRLFMEPAECAGTQVWICRSCFGIWLPGSVASATLSDSAAALDAMLQEGRPSTTTLAFRGLVRVCPECRTVSLDQAEAYAGLRAAVFRCPRCAGIWFEREHQEEVQPPPPPERAEAAAPEPTEPTEAPPPPVPPAVPPAPLTPPPPLMEPPVLSGDEALERLLKSNQRFLTGAAVHPNCTVERVHEVEDMQEPFAVVVTCSDSRVPPEIIFDRGIGDIFVVRNAGGVVTSTLQGSVLYAVDHLGTRLVMVLGHTKCGAVRAAIDRREEAYLSPTIHALQPAVEVAARMPGSHWENAARVHTVRTAQRLRQAIARHVSDPERVRVVAAMYNTETGEVTLVPEQEEGTADAEEETIAGGEAPEQPQAPVRVPSEPPTESRSESAQAASVPVTEQASSASSVAVLNPPGEGAEARFPRWCPKCRQGYVEAVTFCTRCGVLLVRPDFHIRCLKCGKENRIGSDRCYACGADLHPAWLSSRGRKPRPPQIVFPRTGSDQNVSCSSQAVAMGVLALMAWFVWRFLTGLLGV